MGLIRDDVKGRLRKGAFNAPPPRAAPARLSPAGYASGYGAGHFEQVAPYKNPVWKPTRVSLAGRGAAMLNRSNPQLYFNPGNPRLFAQSRGPQLAAYQRQHRSELARLSRLESGAHLSAVSKPQAAYYKTTAPTKAELAKLQTQIVAAQVPQIAGIAAGGDFTRALSRSWPVRFIREGATDFQNSLPGAMYLGQQYLQNLRRQNGNAPLAAINTLRPLAKQTKDQYGRIVDHPLRELGKHPFETSTALFPFVSAGARAVEGASAAATALKASEASGALGPVREAGRAFARAGVENQNRIRVLRSNKEAAQALYGRSAGARLLQKLHDRVTGMAAPEVAQLMQTNKTELNRLYRQRGLHQPADGELGAVTPPEQLTRAEVLSALLNDSLDQMKPVRAAWYPNLRVASERRQNEAGVRAVESVAAEKAAREAGEPPPSAAGSAPSGTARVMDVLNASGRLGQLYMKPSYLWANLLGQGALTGAQQGLRAPTTAARAAMLHRAMKKTEGGRETLDVIHRALAGGQQRGGITGAVLANQNLEGLTRFERGILGAEKGTAALYGKVLDDPWRFNAFIHEAGKAGYRTPQALYTLTHDPTKMGDFTMIQRRANRAMIDYSRMGKVERSAFRRAVYFYPWVKGATMYGTQFLTDHPYLSAANSQLGAYGTKETGRRLGDFEIPSFMQGAFVSGSRYIPGLGQQPKARNLAAASIFGTPAGVAQAIFGGGGQDAMGQTLSDYPSPAITWLQRFLFHYDPSTGQTISEPRDVPSSAIEATKALGEGTFPYRLYDLRKRASRIDKTDLLYPISKGDIAGHGSGLDYAKNFFGSYAFAGPASSRPVNEYVRRQNYRSELTGSIADKGTRDTLSIGTWLPEDLVRETNKLRGKHGLPPLSAHQQLELHQAVSDKLALRKVYDAFKVPGGGRMKPVDRLEALTVYAAKQSGKELTGQQKAFLKKLRNPDTPVAIRNKIPEIVSALEKALFPQRTLPNRIAKPLKTAGARVTIPK